MPAFEMSLDHRTIRVQNNGENIAVHIMGQKVKIEAILTPSQLASFNSKLINLSKIAASGDVELIVANRCKIDTLQASIGLIPVINKVLMVVIYENNSHTLDMDPSNVIRFTAMLQQAL